MKHLDPGTIQLLLDGEASGREKLRANKHIHDCALCKSKLEHASYVLNAVRQNLRELDPDSIPSPASFDPQLTMHQAPKRPFIQVLALASIRVPALLLVLMGGMLVLLTCLLFVEKHHQKNITASKVTERTGSAIILESYAGESKIVLNNPADRFRPVNDPLILVIKKENTNE